MSDPEVDWSEVGHAYGRATDTPGHLANLVAEDNKARGEALTHLGGAIVHQGTLYSATAPAAVAVAELLDDPRLELLLRTQSGGAVWTPPQSMRAALLDFLAWVGECCKADLGEGELTESQLTDWANPTDPLVQRAASSMEFGEFSDDWPDGVFERASEAFYARGILACRRVAPKLLAAVKPFESDQDPAVRLSAANATKKLAPWTNG